MVSGGGAEYLVRELFEMPVIGARADLSGSLLETFREQVRHEPFEILRNIENVIHPAAPGKCHVMGQVTPVRPN